VAGRAAAAKAPTSHVKQQGLKHFTTDFWLSLSEFLLYTAQPGLSTGKRLTCLKLWQRRVTTGHAYYI
jgi:hypothetical protein